MARENAISEYRNVTINFGELRSQTAAPLDAYKALIGVITRLEGQYHEGGLRTLTDFEGKEVRATGNFPFQTYLFEFTTDLANGVYNVVFVETLVETEEKNSDGGIQPVAAR